METRLRTPLSAVTTLAVGGPAEVTILDDVAHLRDVVSTQPGGDQLPVCLGWGSNVLASDRPINVPVILVRTQGITVTSGPEPDQVNVTLQAGHSLIDLVEFAATECLVGVETLAGVPGTVGAMPIQNVGAYGQETADTLNKLTAWDWQEAREVTFSAADCQFGHRTSRFKRSHRWMILTVTFTLTRGRRSAPIIYAELARHLEAQPGARLPLEQVNAGSSHFAAPRAWSWT